MQTSKNISYDGEHYGKKLLQKMGWKKGNGLGKNNNGITSPISTNNNHERKGLGYLSTNENFKEFETSQNTFDSILQNLKPYSLIDIEP